MIKRLLRYPMIAWDFDGTLIDHEKSELMHAFILKHPQKQHFIITFRTYGYEQQMFREMHEIYPDAPGPEHFTDVLNISDVAWEKFNNDTVRRETNQLTGPLTPSETYYVEWKGLTCHRLRLPVLVDDRRTQVLPGCEKYGVVYLHPDDL